jgi:tetratricopeptide (TPR) repeat protein
MDPTAGFLVYAALYRLAIVAAGVVAIVLGYRLFLRGAAVPAAGGGTEAAAEGGGFRLSVRNAAPGTCFALFGAAVIGAMIVQGNPELVAGAGGPGAIDTLRLKGAAAGPAGAGFAAAMAEGGALAAAGDPAGALAAYGRALSTAGSGGDRVARAASAIAAVYLHQGRAPEALALARLAVQLAPQRADHLETLARAARANDRPDEAAAAARRAAALTAAPAGDR